MICRLSFFFFFSSPCKAHACVNCVNRFESTGQREKDGL